ncbi:GntR family transcriptional regulator [Paraburkholderia dilworthii]|uniref:GntR family transcriptional regulator n=1 Tax=Paraburkholderia dilworthii TaxID=948106 RepID=UPI0004885418|nr:GntR family transcriptional regulator [Paraburkholderia dilworthii]
MELEIARDAVEDSPLFINLVFDKLMTDIALCQLAPGERIRQSALAARLQVSRQPISHALQLLKHEGLLQDAGRQGLEVTPIRADYMRLLYQARKPLEATAAGLAAQRVADNCATAEERSFLEQMLDEGQRKVNSHAPTPQAAWADYQFHLAIYRLSGNKVIEQMMNGRWAHIMRAIIASDSHSTLTLAWEEHAAIARTVLRGSVLEASELAARHVQRASSDLYKRLTAGPSGA